MSQLTVSTPLISSLTLTIIHAHGVLSLLCACFFLNYLQACKGPFAMSLRPINLSPLTNHSGPVPLFGLPRMSLLLTLLLLLASLRLAGCMTLLEMRVPTLFVQRVWDLWPSEWITTLLSGYCWSS